MEKINEMEKKMEKNEVDTKGAGSKKVMEIKEETKKRGDKEKGSGIETKREKKR